jgi:hypothetical protein
MTKTWTWKSSPDLMARLAHTQNHLANINQDIMTFAGWCDSEAELLTHVKFYEQRELTFYTEVGR